MSEWFTDSDFWEKLEPIFFHRRRLAGTSDEVESIIRLLQLKPGMKTLDLCCGMGRHSMEFARRGFQVTAVDRTDRYLKKLRENAFEHDLDIEIINSDMRDFRRPDSFDVALNMFTSFGYFADPADDAKVLANVFDSLLPGGKLILELVGKEILARVFQPTSFSELDGKIVLEKRTLRSGWDWIDTDWILIDGDQRMDFRHSQRLYSAAELRNLLHEVGFSNTEAFGSLEGIPYDHEAKRLVVIATK